MVMLSLSVNAIKPDKTYELSEVDQQPEFPGGDTAMYKWIADSLTWNSDVYLSGRVIVEFCIAEDGTVEDVRIKRCSSTFRRYDIKKDIINAEMARRHNLRQTR